MLGERSLAATLDQPPGHECNDHDVVELPGDRKEVRHRR
jgi:hypothetical protein